MNFGRIEGNWRQFKGNVKEQWGKLIGDQFVVFDGKRDQAEGKIQVANGLYRDKAKRQLPI